MSNQRLQLTPEQRALIGTVRELARDKNWRTQEPGSTARSRVTVARAESTSPSIIWEMASAR